jgi:hypothetical protein
MVSLGAGKPSLEQCGNLHLLSTLIFGNLCLNFPIHLHSMAHNWAQGHLYMFTGLAIQPSVYWAYLHGRPSEKANLNVRQPALCVWCVEIWLIPLPLPVMTNGQVCPFYLVHFVTWKQIKPTLRPSFISLPFHDILMLFNYITFKMVYLT